MTHFSITYGLSLFGDIPLSSTSTSHQGKALSLSLSTSPLTYNPHPDGYIKYEDHPPPLSSRDKGIIPPLEEVYAPNKNSNNDKLIDFFFHFYLTNIGPI